MVEVGGDKTRQLGADVAGPGAKPAIERMKLTAACARGATFVLEARHDRAWRSVFKDDGAETAHGWLLRLTMNGSMA